MQNQNLAEIGKRLRWVRKNLRLSQRELADKLGFAQRTISSWEKGEREIPIRALSVLKEQFNININWLLTGEGEPFLQPQREPVKKKTKLPI